jgi:hypothetical protein
MLIRTVRNINVVSFKPASANSILHARKNSAAGCDFAAENSGTHLSPAGPHAVVLQELAIRRVILVTYHGIFLHLLASASLSPIVGTNLLSC